MMARKRKPDAQKVVEGTFRKTRANPDAPRPDADLPMPPAGLSKRKALYFRLLLERLEPLGVASRTDTEALTIAAKRLAEVEAFNELIAEEGRVVDTVNTRGERMLRANPAVSQRSEALRHLQSLLSEFGLTSAARSKVTVKPRKPKTSPFFKKGIT